MEITKKHIFLLIFGFVLYGFLIDQFNNPNFSLKIIQFLGRVTNNKSHTIVDYIKEKANLFATQALFFLIKIQ